MSSTNHNQQLRALDFLEAIFPRIGQHIQSQRQRLAQNRQRAQAKVSVPSTNNFTHGSDSQSGHQQSDSQINKESQTRSQPSISEVITNAETALMDRMGNQRPKSFSEPNLSSRTRLQSLEFGEIVQSQQQSTSNQLEEENRRLNNLIREPEINISSSSSNNDQQTLETMQSGFIPIVPDNTENLRDIQSLSNDQRCSQESQGINSLKKEKFKRFRRFKIADLRGMFLKTRYSRLQSSTRLCKVRYDRAKRGKQYIQTLEDKTLRSEQMNKLSFVYSNVDMPSLKKSRKHNLAKVYRGANEETRRRNLEKYLRKQIKLGQTFIFLVEAYTKEVRDIIREVVQTTTTDKGEFYYYPEHLDYDCDFYATIILSKIKVRFGRMKYSWSTTKMPVQTFCEFEVLSLDEQTIQTFCLFCCHWKSNRNQTDKIKLQENRNIRQYQKECCYDLCRAKSYAMMLLIGDTNLEEEETLQFDPRFTDTYFQSKQENVNFAAPNERISKYKGNYLLVDKQGKVNDVRPGRILVNKESQDQVRVKAKIDDFFLDGCEHLKKDEKKILVQEIRQKILTYIRPFDQMIFKGAIYI